MSETPSRPVRSIPTLVDPSRRPGIFLVEEEVPFPQVKSSSRLKEVCLFCQSVRGWVPSVGVNPRTVGPVGAPL